MSKESSIDWKFVGWCALGAGVLVGTVAGLLYLGNKMDRLKQSMERQKVLAQFKQDIHYDKGVITKQAFRTLMKGIANLCIDDYYQREQQSKKERRSKELSREEYQQMVKRHFNAQKWTWWRLHSSRSKTVFRNVTPSAWNNLEQHTKPLIQILANF